MANLNFTEEDWARVERDTMAWWEGELDRPLVILNGYDPVPLPKTYSFHSNYPLDMPVDAIVDQYEQALKHVHFYADSFPHLFTNFGPGIAAGFLGAQVNSVIDPSETVWFTPSREMPIADLTLEYDPHNLWLKRVKDLTSAFVERYGSMLQVSHADLGCGLDILASFTTTQQLLFDLIEQPEEVDRMVTQVTDLWIRYYEEIRSIIRPTCRGTSCWSPLWSPDRTYMLQCDFSYMISPKMYERFVLPDLARICDHLSHGFYHLDGKGQIPHLKHLIGLKRLRGIQWVSGDGAPSPDQWLPLLKQIRDGGKLCQVNVSTEGARRIVKNLGGKGFMLLVHHPRDQFCGAEEAQAFLDTLRCEDISLNH